MMNSMVHSILMLWALLLAASLGGQDIHHWQEIENTPGTEARPFFFFPDGTVVGYLFASEEIVLSVDQGKTWSFGKASAEFKDFNWNFVQGGLNGHFYLKGDLSYDLYEIDRLNLSQRKIFRSSRQILDYAVGQDHFYVKEDDMLVKRQLTDGGSVASFTLPSNQVERILVTEDERVVCILKNKQLVVLSSDLSEIKTTGQLDINDIRKLKISQELILVDPGDNKFRYSLDEGDSWKEIDAPNVWNNQQHLGNSDYYLVDDSTVYIYDLASEIWKDTVYLDTYLNISGVSDALYVKPTDNSYPGQLYSIKDDGGLQEIPTNIGPPDVNSIKALDSTTFYLHEHDLIYHSNAYHSTINFQRIHKLSSGELVASTRDELYFSENADDHFAIRNRPAGTSTGMTKNELDRLFIFEYNGVYISDDKGVTWTHECPADYFPAFDVIESTVQPKVSNIYYGMNSLGRLLSYNHNTDVTRTAYSNSNPGVSLQGFTVNLLGNVFMTLKNRNTNEVQLVRKTGSQIDNLSEGRSGLSASFAMSNDGQLYIHDGSSIYRSGDRGDSWIDMTGDLPNDITINRISVADDNTVYLGCANGNVHKHIFGDLISSRNQITESPYRLSPNPSLGWLKINRPKASTPEEVVIYTIQGKICHTGQITNSEEMMDLSHLTPGIYIAHFEKGGVLPIVLK